MICISIDDSERWLIREGISKGPNIVSVETRFHTVYAVLRTRLHQSVVESYSATSHRIPCSLSNVFVSSLVWWVDLGRYYEYLILHRAYVDFMLSYPSLFVHLSFRIYHSILILKFIFLHVYGC